MTVAASVPSTLLNKNVRVNRHRTSLRLEPEFWDALGDICAREGTTVHTVASAIADHRKGGSLTSAIRVFVVLYFRALVGALADDSSGPAVSGALLQMRARQRRS
jgi:predicted DNA-binding ribbon-helix-helix protein